MEIANVEQAAAWDGEEGISWAEHADRYDRTSRRHLPHLVNPAIVGPADRVVDIGCGCGKASIEAATLAPEGTVLGVDLSRPMLAVAETRAEEHGVGNVAWLHADAQVHAFEPQAADLVISSFGAMFFGDPVAAFTNLAAALRPGGRLALLAWRDLGRNEWLTTIRGALALGRELGTPPPDAPTPFSFADPDRVHARLGVAGFADIALDAIDEPIDAGEDVDDAMEFWSTVGIVKGLLDGVDDTGRAEGLANLRRAFEDHATADGVLLGTSAWLITACRA